MSSIDDENTTNHLNTFVMQQENKNKLIREAIELTEFQTSRYKKIFK